MNGLTKKLPDNKTKQKTKEKRYSTKKQNTNEITWKKKDEWMSLKIKDGRRC